MESATAIGARRGLTSTGLKGIALALMMYYEWYGAFAGLLMLCYNGKRGSGHKALFYAFYPAHIYIFYILSWGLYNLLS